MRTPTRDFVTRVLYVEANEDGTVGGSHQALFDVATGLDGSSYDPVVLFYQDNSFVEKLQRSGVEVHLYEQERSEETSTQRTGNRLAKTKGVLSAIRRRERFLRANRIGLLHLNNSPAVGYDDWLPAARLAGIPCIVNSMLVMSCVEDVLGNGMRLKSAVKRRLAGGFDFVLPVSDYMVAEMQKLRIPTDRIVKVNHGIDAASFLQRVKRDPDEVRLELDVPPGGVLIAMVGNVRAWKGQHVLIAALAELDRATLEGAKIIFAGAATAQDADYEQSLRDTVAMQSLTDRVAFLGPRSDVPDLLNAADIFVHASTNPEPGGVVVLEAMAAGAAIVAADRGGHVEYLTDGAGRTFDVNVPAQLALILEELIQRPQTRSSLGQNARQRVSEYSLQRNVDSVQEVYGHLLRSISAAKA